MDPWFPDLITTLPKADIPMDGVTGWLLQAEDRQAVFFEIPPGAEVPEHSHGAQWGVVLDGEIALTIGGHTRVYRKGDAYEIPAGVVHSARCPAGARILDLFADVDRYQPRG